MACSSFGSKQHESTIASPSLLQLCLGPPLSVSPCKGYTRLCLALPTPRWLLLVTSLVWLSSSLRSPTNTATRRLGFHTTLVIRLPGKLPSVPTVYYSVLKMSQSRPQVHNPLLIRLLRTSSSTATCSKNSSLTLCPHIDCYKLLKRSWLYRALRSFSSQHLYYTFSILSACDCRLEYWPVIMAVASQPQVNPSWSRWPQHTPSNFSIMSSPGFTPYDLRSRASSQMQRQVSAPYLMGSTYNHSPISAVSPPQYQSHSAFCYVPYHSSPPSTPLGSPFKTEYREHPYMVTEASVVDQRSLQSMKEYQPYSPISRRESVSSNTHSPITPGPATPGYCTSGPISLSPVVPSPLIAARLDNSKTLAYNETLDPADKVEFKTDVDELMKAIQWSRVKGDHQQLITPAPTPEHVATPPLTLPTQNRKPRKQWICDGPSCGRAFTQKTHRDIHQRTHTGYRPYVSVWPDSSLASRH